MKSTRPLPRFSFFGLFASAIIVLSLAALNRPLTLRPIATADSGLRAAPDRTSLVPLVAGADLIVRGRVGAGDAQWDEQHRTIVTLTQVEPLYTLMGNAPAVLTVRTDGGVLQAEGIAMRSSLGVTLIPGQQVLLLLRRTEGGLTPVAGEHGVFNIRAGAVWASGPDGALPLDQFYARLHGAAQLAARTLDLPPTWRDREATVIDAAPVRAQDFVYTNRRWEGDAPVIDFKVNLNSPQIGGADGSTADFLHAILAAADSWSAVDTADFSLRYRGKTPATTTGYNGHNEILFTTDVPEGLVGLARYWYNPDTGFIFEADIAVSEAYDLDATGSPADDEADLQSLLLHEFGHWLSLGHDSDPAAIMYPQLVVGAVRHTLSANDRAGISTIYPCGATSCVPPWLAPPPTATATATPFPTATATPLPTATKEAGGTIPAITPTSQPQPTATAEPAPEINGNVLVLDPQSRTVRTFTADTGGRVTVDVPAGAVSTSVHLQFGALDTPPVVPELLFAGLGFQLVVVQDDVPQPAYAFDRPVDIDLAYEISAAAGIGSLQLLVYDADSATWTDGACAPLAHDQAANILHSSICQTGEFALYREPTSLPSQPPASTTVYLPYIKRR